MIKNYEIKKLQINANIGGKRKGDIIDIKVDKNGTPLDRYWRDRIKDSEIDQCVEFFPAKKIKKETETKPLKIIKQ